jgi:hypothetical protein
MKKKLIEHLLSIAFVSLIFIIVIAGFKAGQKEVQNLQDAAILPYLNLSFIDFDNPLHRAFLRETMNIYYPESAAKNDSLLRAIDQYRAAQAANLTKKLNPYEGLSFRKFWQLAGMYFIFILAYLVVMALTYYGVLTLAILRFLKMKQNLTSYLAELWFYLRKTPFPRGPRSIGKYLLFVVSLLGKALIKGILYIILFSPAYVIAYSFRTGFNTDTFFFMVLLGVISNGLLITYAQKFYTFLAAESRKGYVQTAIVKGLNNNYSQKAPDGIRYRNIFRLRKSFPGHVFQHIYLNARFQYLSTIKEQASFLITGLVIIEMALNIHGHLCYEMLQNILYRQFDVVLTIILGIFWVLKATEIAADYWLLVETRKYDNR